ncbi:xanthine dehydrogenase family protein molybdopterin-binding subunit [Acidiferrobacter sp.]|uniref:xanthine dehydrogenase family protein molybdopterin-binding subunit n=1 Tax=Acidiferrobacter sp. TaxID=1872107 RepID=UPI00261ED04E|nr:xanthine dehydrogenase family protein molybdopterin-binding subunit [Acidiferrobacter sp.]
MPFKEAPLRKDGTEKVRGTARYIADVRYPGMLYGATLRTRLPGGTVVSIDFDENIAWDEYVVVTAKDIPGVNAVKMIEQDQPVLVEAQYRHAGEPVMLVAHRDPQALGTALAAIRIEERACDEGPVFTIEEALRPMTRQIVAGNVYRDYCMEKGSVARALGEPCHVFEGEYQTGAQEHLYIEPQGMIARVEEGVLTVEGSLQCPYYVHAALVSMTGLSADQVRVLQCATGGAFGGKEEYPSHIACHAALLSLKAGGRPVALIYQRAEDMAVTPKRHPSRTRVRLGADGNGRLRFIDIDFVIDGGAYLTLSPVVLSRGMIHAAGPYRCDHVRVRGRAVATSHPPFGAFRGFGAPQSIFALETAMDGLARTLGMPPEVLRARNVLVPGDLSPAGQGIEGPLDMHRVMEEALEASQYHAKVARCRQWNAQGQASRRGMGIATFYHGAGFTGNGELALRSRAGLRVSAGGLVEILTSTTEMGQGMQTTLSEIVAEALQIPYEGVCVARPDTRDVPNSGPTVASRTCMVVGRILAQAAYKLIARLRAGAALPSAYDYDEFCAACARLHASGDVATVMADYQHPVDSQWDESTFQGSPYRSFAWACYVAEVEVDTTTGEARVLDFTAVQEVGRVVHPTVAAGQIEGGVVQGIGYALFEEVHFGTDGQMANNRVTNYIIPTSADVPPIRVLFQESRAGAGPGGAAGIGELPMDGPAPAIINAINAALGTEIRHVPAMPEHILAAMDRGHL